MFPGMVAPLPPSEQRYATKGQNMNIDRAKEAAQRLHNEAYVMGAIHSRWKDLASWERKNAVVFAMYGEEGPDPLDSSAAWVFGWVAPC